MGLNQSQGGKSKGSQIILKGGKIQTFDGPPGEIIGERKMGKKFFHSQRLPEIISSTRGDKCKGVSKGYLVG